MNKPLKPKRFFYHYYKQYNCMSVHFNKQCIRVDNVECNVPAQTKWNKTQPHLVLQGFATEVELVGEGNNVTAIIK